MYKIKSQNLLSNHISKAFTKRTNYKKKKSKSAQERILSKSNQNNNLIIL